MIVLNPFVSNNRPSEFCCPEILKGNIEGWGETKLAVLGGKIIVIIICECE